MIQVRVYDLSFLLLVALAHVANVMGKFCFHAFDFELYLPNGFEAGHHSIDGAKDIDSTVNHLAADFTLGVSFDSDFSAFGVGADMDICITVDDHLATEHVHSYVTAGISFHNDLATGHPAPVAAVCCTEIVACIAFNSEFAALHCSSGECVNISFDQHFTALHPGTGVLVHTAFDNNFSGVHLHAEILDLLHVSFDNNL